MDGRSWLLLTVYFLLILGGAYFASAESSYAAMNKIRIKNIADDGDKRAKRALYIANNFERAITTILVGNNIMHIGCASIATLLATQLSGGDDTYVIYATVITTVIVFLISEMIPKSYAKANSEKLALSYAGSLRFLMRILNPVAVFFMWISDFFSRLFKPKEEPTITEDELSDIIDTAEEEGVLAEEQTDLLQSAMEYSSSTVEDVVTAMEDVSSIELHSSEAQVLEFIKNTKFSRIPVYDGKPENIIGVLQIRKYLKAYIKHDKLNMRGLITPIYKVAAEAAIDDTLQEMSRARIYLALVVDKDGKKLGIVTVEDFLEELVGEIWDEDDVVNEEFAKLGGNRFEISGMLSLREAFSEMDIPVPDGCAPTMILRAWVVEKLGHIPEEGEEFECDNLEITVSDMYEKRIKKVIIKVDYDKYEEDEETADAAQTPAGGDAE